MNRFALTFALLVITVFTACGGGMGTQTQPPPPPPPPVQATVTVNSATSGPFDLAMSTSFQPAEWDYTFFQQFPGATAPLGALNPSHIRLQGISQGVPQTTPTTWNFNVLDGITQPVLGVGDNSPEFQIAVAPSFMYSNGNLDIQQFAGYAQNLVRYYNTGGFNAPDGPHVSPSNHPITWWGIYNEPNIPSNNIPDPATYTSLYNTVVPAMQQVDPTTKFVGVELSGGYSNWEQIYFSYFAQNVTAQVDVVADHFYSSCNQRDSDSKVFSTVPGFFNDVQTIYSTLAPNPALSNVPVWITENNVNADFNAGNGMSACNPGQQFVDDLRGSSAFFAAWRPYVFSQLGKAGVQLLYHWDFEADPQFGELNGGTGQTQLSYWVDYWLGQMFPPGSGARLLNFTNSNSAEVEVLPVINPDGSVVVLISNHAVASASDNNGMGLKGKITLDLSALGSFSTASLVTIDSTTSPITGPTPVAISPASPITLTLNGYSSALLKLK